MYIKYKYVINVSNMSPMVPRTPTILGSVYYTESKGNREYKTNKQKKVYKVDTVENLGLEPKNQ